MRDLAKNPYTAAERRVCAYLQKIAPEVGCGDDPIGFLIASHATLVEDIRLRDIEAEEAEEYKSLERNR